MLASIHPGNDLFHQDSQPTRSLRGRHLLGTCDANSDCLDTGPAFTCFTCTLLSFGSTCPTDQSDPGCSSDCHIMASLDPDRLLTKTVTSDPLDSTWQTDLPVMDAFIDYPHSAVC